MSIKEFLEKKGLIKEYEEFKINISKKRQKESTKKYREKNKDKINKISLKSYYKRKEEKIDIL